MALRTKTLVTDIQGLHDARYCAGMGVELLGVRLHPGHSAYMPPAVFQEVAGWLSGVSFVGIVQAPSDLTDQYYLDYLMTGSVELLQSLSATGALTTPAILQIHLADFSAPDALAEFVSRYAHLAEFLLLSSANLPDTSWEPVLGQLARTYSILLDFPVTGQTVVRLLDQYQPAGLALSSAQEIKTGENDFDQLADVLEVLDTDEFI